MEIIGVQLWHKKQKSCPNERYWGDIPTQQAETITTE